MTVPLVKAIYQNKSIAELDSYMVEYLQLPKNFIGISQ